MSIECRIAVVQNYDDFIAGIKSRFAAIGVTYREFEATFGFASGHVGKLLGDARVRKIGPHTFDGFLEYLACDLVLVDNPERRARMEQFWQKRVRGDYSAQRQALVGKVTINRMFPVIAREMQKRSTAAKSPATRRRVARTAARARWKNRRKARKAKRRKLRELYT